MSSKPNHSFSPFSNLSCHVFDITIDFFHSFLLLSMWFTHLQYYLLLFFFPAFLTVVSNSNNVHIHSSNNNNKNCSWLVYYDLILYTLLLLNLVFRQPLYRVPPLFPFFRACFVGLYQLQQYIKKFFFTFLLIVFYFICLLIPLTFSQTVQSFICTKISKSLM